MKLNQILEDGIQKLRQNEVLEPNLKAKLLLSHFLGTSKEYLVIHNNEKVENKVIEMYEKGIEELIDGKPIQYITNHQEFMKLALYVDENVLIPQPDTEILVERAINLIKKEKEDGKVLDLCTGSGAIAVSIAHYTNSNVYASDISEKALEIAKKNAILNNVKVEFILSNIFKNIPRTLSFDYIISNPPYIESKVIDTLDKEVRREPHIALDGGKDGLEFYRIIAENANEYLKDNGKLLLEIGSNQKEKVIEIFEKTNKYINILCTKDLAGKDRVIEMRKKG